MTFAVGHVQGGTNAGRKRPLREKPRDWTCQCGIVDTPGSRDYRATGATTLRVKPGYLTRCTDCKMERP